MTNIAHYLEAAKIEEVAEQLRSEGYQVSQERLNPDTHSRYDLIAVMGDKKIAIEVKACSQLRSSAGLIRDLREQAAKQGYDEFRLIVVNPPREKTIEIDNIEGILYDHIMQESFSELEELAGRVSVDDISDVDIDSIEVNSSGIDVQGTGLLSASLEYGGGDHNDGLSVDYDFPFTFRITLNHDMNIVEDEIDIDTSSFFE